jgi:hypothetical protein
MKINWCRWGWHSWDYSCSGDPNLPDMSGIPLALQHIAAHRLGRERFRICKKCGLCQIEEMYGTLASITDPPLYRWKNYK